ncbi:MAG: pyruvate formate lyase family protein [Pseudomonadota bacterium]
MIEKILSPQEERIISGKKLTLVGDETTIKKRQRVNRMLETISREPARLSVDRARWFTESYKETAHLPITLRWAKGIENVARKIDIYIGPDELIVGRCGSPGRYGILYPELDCTSFGHMLEKQSDEKLTYMLEKKDLNIIRDEILPYWKGNTFLEALADSLPEETLNLFYKNGNMYEPSFVLHETATVRHSLQWCLDYEKVLKRGLIDIKREAKERLASLDIFDSKNNYDKMPFYRAVIIVCDAMVTFAKRHADLARKMAGEEPSPVRKKELLEIAERCEWVPGNPARSFIEAVQSQWFAQVGSRFEQLHGGVIGNGRIDQYLYPYYKKDIEEGRITDSEVLESLECLWLNMAQCVRLQPTPAGFKIYEGNAHFEHTNIGGLLKDGSDATNKLSYLILESKKAFPLDYPDLAVRIHSKTPDPFLKKVVELIKEGTGFPKLMNDEEIIPLLLAKGAPLAEARNYTGSGCTEVRLLNRNTYFTGTTWMNLGAVLEMALNDGKMQWSGDKRIGVATGDPRHFKSYEDLWNAFRSQLENAQKHVLIQQYITDTIRPSKLAAPVLSSLHDLCMENGKDVTEGRLEGGISLGGQTGIVGFGAAIDSLAAIRKLVFEDKAITMDQLLEVLENNFENEILRQMCLNAPKYGNGDSSVDAIGRDIEEVVLKMMENHTNAYGGKPELFYVPVTTHVAMGRVTGATPNGRKAGQPLSEGVSPSQGADTKGPTVTLSSIAATKLTTYTQRAARLLNLKLTPQAVAGEKGTRDLMSLIRTWCDQKHWHLQFNIINRDTLLAAKKDPEKYKNLLVRVAGYSAYFVDLSPDLQDEIIARTEHMVM